MDPPEAGRGSSPTFDTNMRKNEIINQPPGEYVSCGVREGVEILRFRHNDGSWSGIIFKAEGKLVTARHVVEAHHLTGFRVGKGDIDIAVKDDPMIKGLKLGYVDSVIVNGVKVITSTIEKPKTVIEIPGTTSIFFSPTFYRPFNPDRISNYKLFKPGVSGSPVVYKNHIIGMILFSNIHNQNSRQPEVAAMIFNGGEMRSIADEMGLVLEEVT